MALNRVHLQGRIPTSDKLPFELINGDDEKRAVLRGMISVARSYKKPEEQYYPEDLLFFKVFGATAIFMNKYFKRGDNLILEGEVRKDDDYQKGEETVRGQMYIHVIPQGCHFQKGNPKSEDGGETAAPAKAASAPAKTNPLAGGKSAGAVSNPLKKRSIV